MNPQSAFSDDWKSYKLSEIITLIGGGTPKTTKTEYWGGDIPWLSVKDFNNDFRYVYTTEKTITRLGLEQSSTTLLQKDDIIISARGTVGETAMIPYPMAFNQSCYGIRAKRDLVNSIFLYYLLKTSIKSLKNNAHGSVFDTITRDTFDGISIDLPPLPVQKKIAAILSSLDDKIELNTRMNKVLEEIARALFHQWFVAFEFPNAEGKPYKSAGGKMVESEMGSVPEGWRCLSLGDICDSVSKKHCFNKDELIFLNTGDIENGSFLHNNYSSVNKMPGQAKKSIQRGDVLYSEIRPINRHFAYVNFDSDDYVVSTKLMVIRSRSISGIRLYHYLTSPFIITQLQAEAESRSGTFPQIRFENLQQINMLIGTEDVEKQFGKLLELFYTRITENVAENTLLAEMRDGLLPKLMNGDIEV